MKVTALIVTYNRLDKLKKTLEATFALPFYQIVVVNNASTDETLFFLNALQDDRLTILNSDTNTGGAGGFKLGAEFIALAAPTDWVVFYDDDAFPEPDFFDSLSSVIDLDFDCHCSKVLDLSGAVCKMNIPWKKIPRTLKENLLYSRNPSLFIPSSEQPDEVKSFSFVGVMIRYDVICDSYNYINENLFLYFDDVYYSHQIISMGKRIRYSPELVFKHDVKMSDSHDSVEWKLYYLIRNLILSQHMFGLGRVFTPLSITLRVLKYTLDVRIHSNKYQYMANLLKGIRDGLLNRTGKRH